MSFIERTALPDDADAVSAIINKAGAGLVSHLLDKLLPGFSGESLLSSVLLQGGEPYSLDNMLLLEHEGKPAGLLFSYPAAAHAIHPLMNGFVPSARIDAARPILERSVPGSLYVNCLWTAEELRGTPAEDLLLERAVQQAAKLDLVRISLFCWNDDADGLRFYARHGFELAEHFPRESLPIKGHDAGGSLLCKSVSLLS